MTDLQPDDPVTPTTPATVDPVTPATTATLSLPAAVAATGVSESTLRRWRRDGRFPNATRDPVGNAWRLPVADLLAAGLTVTGVELPAVEDTAEPEVGDGYGTVPFDLDLDLGTAAADAVADEGVDDVVVHLDDRRARHALDEVVRLHEQRVDDAHVERDRALDDASRLQAQLDEVRDRLVEALQRAAAAEALAEERGRKLDQRDQHLDRALQGLLDANGRAPLTATPSTVLVPEQQPAPAAGGSAGGPAATPHEGPLRRWLRRGR